MRCWWRGRPGGSGGGGSRGVRWQRLARVCGLSDRQVVRTDPHGKGKPEESHAVGGAAAAAGPHPGHSVELKIRARAGQTLAELETGAERIATTFGAVAHRVRPVSGSTVRGAAGDGRRAHHARPPPRSPEPAWSRSRSGSGAPRPVGTGGCSCAGGTPWSPAAPGAGKGSVLWGICCGLAPAVRADVVRLWGIDLKRGVELAMGEPPVLHPRLHPGRRRSTCSGR